MSQPEHVMARKISFKQTLDEATRVAAVWETLPRYKVGSVVLTHFVDTLTDSQALLNAYTKKKYELAVLKQSRDKKIRELSNLTTRFRSAMWSEFGRDSTEYALAGGTPNAARKRRRRKTT